MKKTFKELNTLDNLVGDLYKKNPELKNSKFSYAYKRFAEQNFYPILKEYREKLADIRIDHALEDTVTKAVITDPNPDSRGFKYSKEGLKALIKSEKEIDTEFMFKEIEIEPYIISNDSLPEDLGEEDLELIQGCLI